MPTSQTGAQRAPSLPPIPQAALKHLERPRSYLGMSLIDFYSVFNTIQHHLMMQKLMRMYRSVNTPSLLRMYRSVNTPSLLRTYRSVNTQSLLRTYRSVNTQSLLRTYRSVNTPSLLRPYRSVNTPSLLRMYRSVNTQSLLKKGTQRLHCVKKLKWFSICPKLLEVLYRATVESTVAFNSPSFSGGQREGAQLGYALQDHQYS